MASPIQHTMNCKSYTHTYQIVHKDKKKQLKMNSTIIITSSSKNTICVQINPHACVTTCLSHLLPSTTDSHQKV